MVGITEVQRAAVKEVKEKARAVRKSLRELNMACAKLNGTAVTIPFNAPYPLDSFIASKVILNNVGYGVQGGVIKASIKIPYGLEGDPVRQFGGHIREFEIDETWFS